MIKYRPRDIVLVIILFSDSMDINKISKIHKGYRSVFTWYMWRSIDPVDVEY